MLFVVTFFNLFALLIKPTYAAKFPDFIEGTETGNGGFAVICESGSTQDVQFYDVYAMEQAFGLKFPEHTPQTNEDAFWVATDMANKILLNYSKLDPLTASGLKNHLKEFWEKSKVKSEGQIFVEIHPPEIKKIPEGCKLQQIISFLNIHYPPYTQNYVIDAELFLKMPTTSQAAALLHEVLYKESFYQVKWLETYRYVVQFNSFLLSIPNLMTASHNDILIWQSKNVVERFKNKFLTSHYSDYTIRCFNSTETTDECSVSFYPSGKIKTAFLKPSFYKTAQYTGYIFIEEMAEFSENGRLMSADILRDYTIRIAGQNRLCSRKLFFNEKGEIINCL